MATYASLTDGQKALVGEGTDQLRAIAGQINKLLRDARAVSDLVGAGAGAIVTSLDAGEVIPNTSGLGGSQDLTKEEVIELYQDVNSALSSFASDLKRQLQTKAAGINAI